MMIKLSFIAVALTAVGVNAICPGFNFGIADLGNQNCVPFHFPPPRFAGAVYPLIFSYFFSLGIADHFFDDSCNIVETVVDPGANVCTNGQFSCSPPPITITGANILGNWYVSTHV